MLTEQTVPDTSTDESSHIPEYEPPNVLSYSQEDLMQELGPARACSFSGSVVGCTTGFEQWLREQGYQP